MPGILGGFWLLLLLGLSVVFLAASHQALQRENLRWLEAARKAAFLGLPVHFTLAFFCTDTLFNFHFTFQQPWGRYPLGFLLLALTSGLPGDLYLIFLSSKLGRRLADGSFQPDRQVFKQSHKHFELFEALFIALVLAIFIRIYFVQAFKIPSGSMEDTLLIGDHLLVNKFIYGTRVPVLDREFFQWRDPRRGDIIVFEFPQDATEPYLKRRDFIKRVIGLPGDLVEIRAKQVFVNGQLLHFPQQVHKSSELLPAGLSTRDFVRPFRIPEGKYFVLGDNRDFSFDSRFWGFVEREKIKGLAWIKYWSRDRGWPRWERIGRPIH
ncbi:MAG: signal peptidase I [Deltaproteobacteria bacterium]|nr:signal peptidase I [Deltaproteobacteria bacterium]